MSKNVLRINHIAHNAQNLVEEKLRLVLKRVVEKNPNWGWEQISLQDVYACAINRLPVIYVKKGETATNVPTDMEIEKAIKTAMYKVIQNPIHLPANRMNKAAQD